MRYDHQSVEAKWQAYWEENQTFKSEIDTSKEKYYVLDMFPYPSGSGLHVGHVVGYTATDIMARYMRMKGRAVLHPMGWDSFGLPAEQHAIRTGTHPAIGTQKNIDNFRRQLKALGFSYDWGREFATSSPDYYKWTQWIFTKLYEKGLAYEADMQVNFCPALGTVLSNEEVENGRSVEGGYPVERRPLRQWVLKITAYAQRLIDDLDLLDWPDSLKRLQRNWIGKSTGINLCFSVVKDNYASIEVYTTRPDTLFGATYLVLAPEHSLVDQITTEEQKAAVQAYCQQVASKSDLDRTELAKEKTGVFTGAYATNPVNGAQLPIWVADYVLVTYAKGAVMAVPNHDERDFAFAQAFKLPITPVFNPDLENHADLIPEGVSAEDFRARVLAGEACWMGEGECINSANDEISLNGLSIKEAKQHIIAWLEDKGHGQGCVNYKLRDWLFSRQRYWGEPFPILHFEDGSKRCLELDELPLVPPEIDDYKPSSDGESPLTKAQDWVSITDPKTGKAVKRETNTMPQWAGSCWYYLRFCDPLNTEQAWSQEAEKYWMGIDLYVGGVEHAVLHLLYARFWHKVFYDCGLVSQPEPFKRLVNQGLVTARSYQKADHSYVSPEDVRQEGEHYFHKETGEVLESRIDKMSKSKLNGVSPDEIIEEMGADALRLYEMFLGPLEKPKIWDSKAVYGCRRFLNRFFDLVTSDKVTDETNDAALKLTHRLVDGVERDIEKLFFNTAIAKMMEWVNGMVKLDSYPRSALRMAVLCLAPFAPHLAEELWALLGGVESLTNAPFPQADPSYLVDSTTTYVVQVNGKLRGRLDLPKDQEQELLVEQAKKDSAISKYIDGQTIRKVIFVPNKLLNFVLQ